MFRKLLLLASMLWLTGSQAQNIQNITFTPAFPGPTDSVKVIAELVFNSGTCELQYENHAQSNDSIRINVFHCPGALTVICNTTDTINLGILQAGTHVVDLIVHIGTWSLPDPCSDENPVDSGNIQITVLPGSGLETASAKKSFVFYHRQAGEIILGGRAEKETSLFLFNAQGSLVLKQKFDGSNRIPVPTLSTGVYMYQIRTGEGNNYSGKFAVE